MAVGDYKIAICPQCKRPDQQDLNRMIRADSMNDIWWVLCKICGLRGDVGNSREEAIDKWTKIQK